MYHLASRFMPWVHDLHAITHWGRVTLICVSKLKLIIIASDNGLSPGRRQAIIWASAGILLIGPSGTNFSEILMEIITLSFKKMRLKVSSVKWRPCCLPQCVNTLRWDKTADIWTTLSNAFSWMKMYECWLKFDWSLFLWFQLTIF